MLDGGDLAGARDRPDQRVFDIDELGSRLPRDPELMLTVRRERGVGEAAAVGKEASRGDLGIDETEPFEARQRPRRSR